MPHHRSHLIRGGRLLDAASRRTVDADVLVTDGVIAHIGEPGMPAPADAKVFDARHMLLHPGLVNSHTHSGTNLVKATHDRWTLELLLNGAPGWSGQHSQQQKYLATTLGAVELLQKGCTSCYDLSPGFPLATVDDLIAIGQAYVDAGLRAVVAPMLQDLSFYRAIPGLFDALPAALRERLPAPGGDAAFLLAQMEEAFRRWPHDPQQVRLGLAPTIPLHCSDELIRGCVRLAQEHGAPMQSHVAESKVQALSAQARWGHSLVEHCRSLGMLGPNFTVAHGVWLDDDDMRRLADHGCSVAHNPGSNMRLGAGIADARRLLELGVNLALGTDGALCADNQNMYEAMRYASMAASVRQPDPERWLTAPEIFHAATQGGARATGFHQAGRLAVGAWADIVFLDLQAINWIPVNDPASQVVLTEDATSVRHVMVGGQWVVSRGKHLRHDLADLAIEAQVARAELIGKNAPAKALSDALEAAVSQFCVGLCRRPYPIHRYGGPVGL